MVPRRSPFPTLLKEWCLLIPLGLAMWLVLVGARVVGYWIDHREEDLAGFLGCLLAPMGIVAARRWWVQYVRGERR